MRGTTTRKAFLVAGTVDAVGLAFGWTAFVLAELHVRGLRTVATYNAAMLAGIVLAAPVIAALRRRASNRTALRAMSISEAALRGLLVVMIGTATSSVLVALLVVVLNVAAWSGYACMRTEVLAHSDSNRSESLGWYGGLILAAEGLGAALAAMVPLWIVLGGSRWVIATVYVGALIPTIVVAQWASAERSHEERVKVPLKGAELSVLATGVGVSAAVAGPFLLYVALAERLWGSGGVAVAAAAVTVGALLAPFAVRLATMVHLPETARWAVWAAGAVVAWSCAAGSMWGLALAGCLSGLSITAFEASMDDLLSRPWADGHGQVNISLARGAAARAIGGAIAVQLAPTWIDQVGLRTLAIGCAIAGSVIAVLGLAYARLVGQRAFERRLLQVPWEPPAPTAPPLFEPRGELAGPPPSSAYPTLSKPRGEVVKTWE
jgi:hypothetical protein